MQLVVLICVVYVVLLTYVNAFVLPRGPRASNVTVRGSSDVVTHVSDSGKNGFDFMELDPLVVANLTVQCIIEPRPIQVEAFNAICNDETRNVLITAETGCGKTLAYTLPLLKLITCQEMFASNPRAVIMVPNRILTHQVHTVVSNVIRGTGITVELIDDIETQEMPSIVIGTPLQLLRKFKVYNLNFKIDVFQNVRVLVLDEADQVVEETNEESMREFLKLTKNRVKTVLAAATVSTAGRLSTENTIDRFFRRLKIVKSKGVHSVPENIDPEFVYCADYDQKVETLLDVMKQVTSHQRAIIFCGSVESSNALAYTLKRANPRLDIGLVNRDVDIAEQLAALDPEHGNKFIVCTDTLARGIDLGTVSVVVQFDFPTSVLHYIHRAGRAGRNMQRCKTVLLWTDSNREFYTLLNEYSNDLGILFSRKRGLRKRIKRGAVIAPATATQDESERNNAT